MNPNVFHQFLRAVGVLCLAGGLVGTLLGLWSLVDPTIIPQTNRTGASAMTPSWIRSTLLLVFSITVGLYGARMTFPERAP